MMDYCSV